MPVYRSSRRAGCTRPKYTFSDDEDDDDFLPPKVDVKYSPLAMPPPSATPSARSSHARKRPDTHIRRPRNAFIIFRSEFCERQKMKENGIESDHRHISRIAAHVWNSLPKDQKAAYKVRAENEKAEHRAAYPDYRYVPVGKPKQVKRKVKRDDAEDKARCLKLAELLISGVAGVDLQQAAKAIDVGVADVGLTQRTAPKRVKRDRRQSPGLPASKPKAPVKGDIMEESTSPPQSLGQLPPLSSTHALCDSPESADGCDDDSTGNSDFSEDLPYYPLPPIDVLFQTLRGGVNVEAPSPHMRPSATGNVTLAALFTQDSLPPRPRSPPPAPRSTPYSLPPRVLPDSVADVDWFAPSFPFPALSGTPSSRFPSLSESVDYAADLDAPVECSHSTVISWLNSPKSSDADSEMLVRKTEKLSLNPKEIGMDEYLADKELELCYPDEVDIEDYPTGV